MRDGKITLGTFTFHRMMWMLHGLIIGSASSQKTFLWIKRLQTSAQWSSRATTADRSPCSFLDQSYTWSRLQICEEHFRKLCTCLEVHPDFLAIVYLFCEKVRPVEESFSRFFINYSNQQDPGLMSQGFDCSMLSFLSSISYDLIQVGIGYNIKYVSRHGRKFPKDPFSIREVGVYQQFSSGSQTNSWVILQAPAPLQDRLRRALGNSNNTAPGQQFQLHPMILLCVSEDWRDYLSYLEEEFSLLVGLSVFASVSWRILSDRGFYTNIKGPQFKGDLEADYSDIRKLHLLTDKLQRLRHILGLNIRLGHQMKHSLEQLQNQKSAGLLVGSLHISTKLEGFIYDQQTSSDRISNLLERSTGIGQLVQSILEIRAAEAGKIMNLEMKKLTEQGIEENRLVKRLTQQTTRDTKAMKIIALVSAIFIPATFMATLFGSNFFIYSEDQNKLTVASNFWVYIVFTAGLSGTVITMWMLWKQWGVKRHKGNDLESQQTQ
ncbi:Mg2+ transporter -like Zinc transport protein [Rutstroemia sp. NJR-2017a BVV2]|nr:Mg2+ transporter -like Zinc transport protein [Rutstroemia sp. NJR-2017a BVV2]